MKQQTIMTISVTLLFFSLLAGIYGCANQETKALSPQERLQVATTTSLYDTGLWGHLEPIFEEEYGVEVDILYAGTGIALEWGKRGDVDVITVHSKSREEAFVADGYGIERIPFAYNYFLIVGPEDDPVKIKGMNPEDAFKELFNTEGGSFISRGDDSGTHGKEKIIWKQAGFDYESVRESGQWYVEAGRGMGPTLLMASEMQAYTLTDIGTFLSYQGEINLVPIVDKGNVLLNIYSAIVINPDEHPKTNAEMAENLIQFLTSPDIQELIENYGIKEYGMQLFIPCAGNEPTS